MSRLILPLEKREHTQFRQPCEGTGATGERYEMTAGEHVLLLEVFCPACGGCGNGDPRHAGCKPEWHADSDDDEGLDFPGDDDPGSGEPGCWSCGSGRGWNAVQGFRVHKDYTRDGAVRVIHHFWSMGTPIERHQQELARYAQAITAAGYRAEITDGGWELTVTARED